MKIVETLTPTNAGKTIIGERDVKLTLDTETGELSIETPAMWGDPVVSFDELKRKIENLTGYQEQGR